jgi:intracellular septation protein
MKKMTKNVIKEVDSPKISKKAESLLKFLTDFLPILLFFGAYKFSNHPKPIIPATIFLVSSCIIALAIAYIFTRKIAKMPLISSIILGIFGSITIFSGNDVFIKMKPTILNLLFGMTLFVGHLFKKPLLDYLFDSAISMNKEAWLRFSLRWAYIFIFLAILYEVIWRNFSTDFWVQFKVFGMLPISIAFAIINMPFIIRETERMKNKGN